MGASATAQAPFHVPAFTSPVVDDAGILDEGSAEKLRQALLYLQRAGKTQIAILTVPSLEGVPVEQAAINVYDKWKLGGEKSDDGILILVAPKDRATRIEVAQGLEGLVPDSRAKKIISESMLPLFRENRYADGLMVAVFEVAKLTNPDVDMRPVLEGQREPTQSSRRGSPGGLGLKIFFWIGIVFFLILANRFNPPPGGSFRRRGGIYSGGGWGGSGGSSWGGGGGFSGGGGGSSSGGGASGSW